jgi:predicted CXXCH cytochrome family protein
VNFLIRTIENRDSGSFEYRDNEYSGQQIAIGRATDQDIQLVESEVALQHAVIQLRGKGRGGIKALTSTGAVVVNDKIARSAPLQPGDTIRIGRSVLEVINAPPGFDFALTLERGEAETEEDGAAPGSQYVTTLAEAGLRKRSWSWLLFLAVVAVFFAIPASGLIDDRLRELTRSSPVLPDDGVWLSGPLLPAHGIPEIGDDCNVCHARPFKMVRNEQCTACHDDMGRHAPDDVHMADLDEARCGSCHKEHNEPPTLVRQDEALCADCHRNLSTSGVETGLADASSFAADHPPFQLSMLMPETSGDAWQWRTMRVAQSSSPREISNLKFPHDAHLDPQGVKSPEGDEVLECSSCHTLDARGMLMKPITMEDNCRRCHTLVFDPDAPDREVPHGDPDKVILSLEEYYSREFLEDSLGERAEEASPPKQRRRQRRRPGKTLDPEQRLVILKLARDKAWEVAEQLFEKTTCLTCHEVSRESDPDLLSNWRVDPVRLTAHWLPKHEFNHYSHRMEDCGTCHEAETSAESSDVLMPDIETCRACHGGPDSRLATTCVGCHNFHLAGRGIMK